MGCARFLDIDGCLVVVNFEDVELFHVKLRIGIYNDLLADAAFEVGDQGIFFSQQQLCYLRIYPQRQARAVHIMGVAQNLTVDAVADGLA